MAEIQSSLSPQEEIRKLEQQLEQKKRELAETGAQVPEEKELFREVLKEHIEILRPAAPVTPTPPAVPFPPIPPPVHDTASDIKEQEARDTLARSLVEKAITGTIEDAIKQAQAISPYMLDELHDRLVDDMYAKLLTLRKIKTL